MKMALPYLATLLLATASPALVFEQYSPQDHDRFRSETWPFDPQESGKAFYAGFDLTGIGWQGAAGGQSAALISPQHFITATHFKLGGSISFLNQRGEVVSFGVESLTEIPLDDQGHQSDMTIGRLDRPITAADEISFYRAAPLTVPFCIGREVISFGTRVELQDGTTEIRPMAGRTALNGFFAIPPALYDDLASLRHSLVPDSNKADRVFSSTGDSGSPSFVPVGEELILLGQHFSAGSDSFVGIHRAAIDALLAADGYTLRVAEEIADCGGLATFAPPNLVSTATNTVIDGRVFTDGELISLSQAVGSASSFLSEAIFLEDEQIDAAAMLGNGNLVLSTETEAQLGSVVFQNGDLVEYDPTTSTAGIFLDESVFGTDVDIDAVHVLPDGRILLSFRTDTLVFGISFLDGDVAAYDPETGGFSHFLSETIFGNGQENVSALSVLPDGDVLLATEGGASIGSLAFSSGDVVEWNPATGQASVFLRVGQRSSTSADVDALAFVPRPACADGRDNDGDGSIDYPADSGCTSLIGEREDPQCSDGVDNDGDGQIDFDGAGVAPPDLTCAGDPSHNRERSIQQRCGLGFELTLVLGPLCALRARRRRTRRERTSATEPDHSASPQPSPNPGSPIFPG